MASTHVKPYPAGNTTPWHTRSAGDVVTSLNAHWEGLPSEEAKERVQRYGENKLPEAKTDGIVRIFLREFQSPLIYLLLIAGIVVFLLEEHVDAALIFFVIFFNAIIGTIQTGRAQNTLAALKTFSQTNATVVRDGVELIIPDTLVVPGDVIVVQEGEKIPADARILEAHNLRIDESALTGESSPVNKYVDQLTDPALQASEQKNMLFKGTHVVGGNGRAIVVATGIATVFGKISHEITKIETEIPLQENIRHLTHYIIIVVLVASVFIFVLGTFVTDHSFIQTLKLAVAVVVSSVPEGLPIVMTLLLATGVWRMSKHNVIVKNMQAVEALGEAQVIAVDKTGTVTKNELVVEQAYTDGMVVSVSGVGYDPTGSFTLLGKEVNLTEHAPFITLAHIAAYTAGAQLTEHSVGNWQVSGDPTEAALLVFAQKAGIDREKLLQKHPCVGEIPFDTRLKFHASVHRAPEGIMLAVAGAAEIVLDRATKIEEGGAHVPLTDIHRAELTRLFESLAHDGLRVIALARRTLDQESVTPDDVHDLTLVGFVAMRDALRAEVPDAMRAAHGAGVRVVMITGDHPETARAIARAAGIYADGDRVITGVELETLDDEALKDALGTTSVFARVTPEHKLRIVQGYRLRDEIVAMTGDGVNDALSLVAADLGVAMGKNGTEVAKEAADLVLTDDNFGSIIAAIEEGRNIYQNIKKVLLFLFSSNIGELLYIIVALALGFPLPILAAQLIWLNLVTDGFLDIGLVMEPKEKTLLTKKFTRPGRWFFDTWMVKRLILMSSMLTIISLAVFAYYYGDGSPEHYTKAISMSLTVMAIFQWIKAWNCRSETRSVFTMGWYTNKYLAWATLIVISLHVFAMNTPFMQHILGVVPLSLSEWGVCIGVAFSTIGFDEFGKYLRRRSDARDRAKERVARTA